MNLFQLKYFGRNGGHPRFLLPGERSRQFSIYYGNDFHNLQRGSTSRDFKSVQVSPTSLRVPSSRVYDEVKYAGAHHHSILLHEFHLKYFHLFVIHRTLSTVGNR